MADFYALGEMLIDFTPSEPTPAGIPVFAQNPGGAPANVAVQAARLGVSSGFIGKVGSDMFGMFLKKTLEDQGVDTANLFLSRDTATSLAFVHLDKSGDRDFSFYRNPGADTQITFEEVRKEDLAKAKVLCFGSLLLTAEPAKSALPEIVRYAREHGVITAYDPNWRQPLWPDDATGIAAMKSLLPLADVIKTSDDELELLTGCKDIAEGTAQLFRCGIQIAVITCGAGGSYICTRDFIKHIPTYRTGAIDTTGSGDSFFGSFLTRIMETGKPISQISRDELIDAAEFGNASGAMCATKKGAIPALPDREAIENCRRTVPKMGL